jgi:hypothetical protein
MTRAPKHAPLAAEVERLRKALVRIAAYAEQGRYEAYPRHCLVKIGRIARMSERLRAAVRTSEF